APCRSSSRRRNRRQAVLFRKRRPKRPFECEIEYHLDRVTRDHIAEGMDPHEARRRARLEFGGVAQVQEDMRDVHRPHLADLHQDLIYAVHTLRRSPGFLACAVLRSPWALARTPPFSASSTASSCARHRSVIRRVWWQDRPGAALVAVLSYACWIEHFGGSPAVSGRTVRRTANDAEFTI